jgi:hypothetical protein
MKVSNFTLLIILFPVIVLGQKRLDSFYRWSSTHASDSISYEYGPAANPALDNPEMVKMYIHENGAALNDPMKVPNCHFSSARYFPENNPGALGFTLSRTYTADEQVAFEEAVKADGTTDQWLYNYDLSGNITDIKYMPEHTDSSYAAYLYNGDNQLIVKMRSIIFTGDERLMAIDSFQYDASGNQIYESHYNRIGANGHEDMNSTMKHISSKQSGYDPSGISFQDSYAAATVGGPLEYLGRTRFFHSAGHIDSTWFFNTHNGVLNNDPQTIDRFFYDDNSNMVRHFSFQASPSMPLFNIEYEYDADNYLTSVKEMANTGQGFGVQELKRYHYSDIAGINEQQLIELNVYPNPATDQISIHTAENVASVTVATMTGAVVLVHKGNGEQLSVQQLPAGAYFVTVTTTEGKTGFRQFIKR